MSAAAAAIDFYASQHQLKSELRSVRTSGLRRSQSGRTDERDGKQDTVMYRDAHCDRESHLVGRISLMKAQCNKKLEDLYSAYTTVRLGSHRQHGGHIFQYPNTCTVKEEAPGSPSREGGV